MCVALIIAAAITTIALLSPVSGFPILPSRSSPPLLLLQAARSSTADVVQQVKPRSSSSHKKREEAIKAMQRTQVESALDGVDAQMLELLSDQYLYPSIHPKRPTSRPNGRPDFVAGAMRHDTLVKYRERKEMGRAARDKTKSDASSALYSQPEILETMYDTPSRKVNGKKQPSSVKGANGAMDRTEIPEVNDGAIKKRKRVVKNLPERRDRTQIEAKKSGRILKGKAKANNLELQKYYRTELLTGEEEYSLGVTVQLMVKCEQVHEGLAIHLMRLPTIEEWANACG
jgi:hypothetical protein